MLLSTVAVGLAASAPSLAFAQADGEAAKLNALFDAFMAKQLRQSPETATGLGLDVGELAWTKGLLTDRSAEAITATGRLSGSIAVSIHEKEDRIEIVLRDDGEGFDQANAPTLFQRGFSTRAHKSGGLGLHWCANSMNAMAGSLRLTSEGMGMGAVAILTLQAAEAVMADAA